MPTKSKAGGDREEREGGERGREREREREGEREREREGEGERERKREREHTHTSQQFHPLIDLGLVVKDDHR